LLFTKINSSPDSHNSAIPVRLSICGQIHLRPTRCRDRAIADSRACHRLRAKFGVCTKTAEQS
jgi:hypothetical protein